MNITLCSAAFSNTADTLNAMLQATGYLKGSAVGNNDNAGYSVAVSGDGSTAAVGLPGESGAGAGAGAVYIYKKDSLGDWAVQPGPAGALRASNAAAGDQFGTAVSLSDDGNRLIVGAPDEDGTGASSGAAYLFTRTGTTWAQTNYVKASNASTGDLFGSSVAISGDGLRFIVGAPLEDTGTTTSGAAYAFTFNGTVVANETLLKATTAVSNTDFGGSVAINQGGTILAVGAKAESNGGSVYTFTFAGTSPAGAATAVAPSPLAVGDEFGTAISLSDEGTTLAVGASSKDGGAGAVYIFAGATFAQQAVVTASNGEANDHFGSAVSLSDNGNTLIVGAPDEDSDKTAVVNCLTGDCGSNNLSSNSGAAYRFTRSGTTWSQKTYIKATNTGASDQFGFSVSVSDTEERTNIATPFTSQTLVIGAPFEDGALPVSNPVAVNQGSVTTNNDALNSGAAYLH